MELIYGNRHIEVPYITFCQNLMNNLNNACKRSFMPISKVALKMNLTKLQITW